MTYRERLYPSSGAFLALSLLFPAAWLAWTPINPDAAWLISGAVTLAVFALAFTLSPQIQVDSETLTAGRITIAKKHLGKVKILCDDDRQRALGVDLDARAQLSTSPWPKCLVRVDVLDQRDPTPYLLLSTRHPTLLAAALGATPHQSEA